MHNWLERLKGESQARLLQLLRRSPHTITALAEELQLSDNAVRTHIAALERDGLIAPAGTQRDTGGKPARVYTLTQEGEELFPKAYAVVLGELVREIALRDGEDLALELMRAVGQRTASAAAVPLDLEGRVAAAASALRRLGGDIAIEQNASGWFLRGFGCPLSSVTSTYPAVCELARALVEEITGQPVEECCERSGRPRCGFRIQAS
jgi:predicted ArsR family transcriptional regulator